MISATSPLVLFTALEQVLMTCPQYRRCLAAFACVTWLMSGRAAGQQEMVFTCVRCVCECLEMSCSPPASLPEPCSFDEGDESSGAPFIARCQQACGRGGAIGVGEEFQQVGSPCVPCATADAAQTAVPALAPTSAGLLALGLLVVGAWRRTSIAAKG